MQLRTRPGLTTLPAMSEQSPPQSVAPVSTTLARPAHVVAVDLAKAYRLINHGPTVLVSSAHGGRRNVMAAAWNMPLDFSPPKVAVVIDRNTYTRELIEASGELALCVPTRAQVDAVSQVGKTTGREQDKLAEAGLSVFAGSHVGAPLVDGCVAWLECRLLNEPETAQRYDLFLAEVVAAWADARLFDGGHWLPIDAPHSTLHHVAGGVFFTLGDVVSAKPAAEG